jgi:3-methyladenine DNA glycosylase/8-oxoguanine DNA glycosylase
VAGTALGGGRIDSGDLPTVAAAVRAQLDDLGATATMITVTSDLDEFAIAALTAIKGVGKWTAETYLMFCEGRLNVFPGGDVALQEAMRWADRAEVRPNEKQAYARAERWRPHRGVAAHLLWGWYGGVRRGEIALEDHTP